MSWLWLFSFKIMIAKKEDFTKFEIYVICSYSRRPLRCCANNAQVMISSMYYQQGTFSSQAKAAKSNRASNQMRMRKLWISIKILWLSWKTASRLIERFFRLMGVSLLRHSNPNFPFYSCREWSKFSKQQTVTLPTSSPQMGHAWARGAWRTGS